uniref:WH2 domain-containing protein n=1 Tax=Trichuris muris TaxID=70415 RepID=A0A5S6PZQ3_TRIMR
MMAAPPPPPLMTQLTPPPPPLPVLPGKLKKAPAAATPADREALFADIRRAGSGGVRLKPTKTNDRSAPIVGGVSETPRSTVPNGPAAAPVPKFTPGGMVDFTSELNRAVSAQHQKTLKRTNGRLATSGGAEVVSNDSHAVTKRPVVPLATKPVIRQPRQPPPEQNDQQPQQHSVKVRHPTISSKPAPNPNKPNFRSSIDSVPPQDSTKLVPTSGVSVKALRAKLQNPSQMAPPSSHLPHRPNGAVGHHELSMRNQSSTLSLSAFGRPSTDQADQERAAAAFSSVPFAKAPPPPLPAKPPSRKPSIEHRRNVAEKFRTLKPQSSVQKQFVAGATSKYRSSSSEHLPGLSPETYVANVNISETSVNNNSDVGSRGVQRVQSHRPVVTLPVGPRPTPPPRPDVALPTTWHCRRGCSSSEIVWLKVVGCSASPTSQSRLVGSRVGKKVLLQRHALSALSTGVQAIATNQAGGTKTAN